MFIWYHLSEVNKTYLKIKHQELTLLDTNGYPA